MATAKLLDDDSAAPEARAVFDEIRAARGTGYVNNFWRALAHDPALLRATWDRLRVVMGPGELDPLVKEMVYMAVSITNNCDYCMASHGASARAKGASDEMMNELIAIVGLANMTNRLANAYKVPVDEAFR